ncbi:MAG: SDR family oxidoreductase [Ectothiorhodospiraceae bacterium]|nr:SDR family oxidoreductase [Ectothiorhodospiraceae bacterium]
MKLDPFGLEGKVAIVTGGGSRAEGIGNGRAASILLARAGARVLVVDRDLALAERTVRHVHDEGGTAIAHAADVTREAECVAMVEAAMDRWGRVDVLDNNVGIDSHAPVERESLACWEQVMQVNVTSMFLAAKHCAPAMRRGGGGAIVNVSSISAIRPRGMSAYTTSKGAVIALTKAMAIDLADGGIRANCVAPGPVYTPMVASQGMSEAARDQRRRASPLAVEGTGWDVGNAVLFLASDMARFVNGQTLVVDGGLTLVAPKREYHPGSAG